MKSLAAVLATVLLALVALLPGPLPNRDYPISNVTVTDGDTVRVDAYLGMDTTRRVTIRLQGIDAWEMRNKPRGPAAREFVVQWFKDAKRPVLHTHNDAPDKYGRTIGIITREDDQVLNEELVKHGHAIEKDWK
jgi:endonuclease YncB( thermonuclease family)